MSEDHRGAGVFEHEAQAIPGVGGVEGHIDPAGPQNGEHADDGQGRALREERRGHTGPNPRGAQGLGHIVRTLEEFGVGQAQDATLRPGTLHRWGVGSLRSLGRDAAQDGGIVHGVVRGISR